jgi:hypothetical protein
MKVSLRREEETSGVFKKTTEYVLYVKVELTPEEKNAIKAAGIEHRIVLEYTYKGSEINYQVKSVVYHSDRGSESRFVGNNVAERNDLEHNLKEGLTALKSQLEEQMSPSAKSETFEL